MSKRIEALRIVRLESANIKRLRAVEISPEGNVVVIGGRNGQGKTSVLDSIVYALGGKGEICDEPLRRGEEHGHIVVDLGDLVVRRTFTESGGGQLTVENGEGARYQSPQAMLDRLVGRLSFDPLEFARMKPAEQSETLRELVELDTSDVDAAIAGKFDERTAVNRTVRNLEGQLEGLAEHEGVGTEEVSIVDLVAERDRRVDHNSELAVLQQAHGDELGLCEQKGREIGELEDLIARLRSELNAAENSLEGTRADGREQEAVATRQRAAIDAFVLEDLTEITAQIEGAEGRNAMARENARRAEVVQEFKGSKQTAGTLTAQLLDLKAKRAAAIEATEFPVDGLGFGEDGVTFGEIPFAQASSSEQLRVSVAIGLAMNPRLRVLLVRDGSLLDDDSMRLLAEMAVEHDAQVWLEVVREDEGVNVVIEDGMVRGAEAVAEQASAPEVSA